MSVRSTINHYRKSHTGFRLILDTDVDDLDDHERRNSPYFAFLTEFDCFANSSHLLTVVVCPYILYVYVCHTKCMRIVYDTTRPE